MANHGTVIAHRLAASGSTGNNTHSAITTGRAPAELAAVLDVEAVGATPQLTWKLQGSLDGSSWEDVLYLTPSSDTSAAAAIVQNPTAVRKYYLWVSNPGVRFYTFFRLVTTANTNTTYGAFLYLVD